jgi:hypothetical protein
MRPFADIACVSKYQLLRTLAAEETVAPSMTFNVRTPRNHILPDNLLRTCYDAGDLANASRWLRTLLLEIIALGAWMENIRTCTSPRGRRIT